MSKSKTKSKPKAAPKRVKSKTTKPKLVSAKVAETPVVVHDEPLVTKSPSANTITLKRDYVIAAGLILVAGLLIGAYAVSQALIVATVNGQPISRLSYIKEMESQTGERTLDNLITQELIVQQADKEGVVVEEQEVEGEIETVRATLTEQGQDLEQLLELQGMTLDELRVQIRLQKMLGRLAQVAEDVSADELAVYIETNKDMFPEDLTGAELDEYAKERYLAENNQGKIQAYIQQLRSGATIQYQTLPFLN